MTIPFTVFFQRVCQETEISTQMGLAKVLGVNRSAITQAKIRDAVPEKWILALARKCSLSPDWLEYGTGPHRMTLESGYADPVRNSSANPMPGNRSGSAVIRGDTSSLFEEDVEIVYIPKAAARLCAGGGSFEVEATPVSAYPFPRWWLAKMGSPTDMIFMDVVGDSMEPGINDGDTVLVDQSHTRIDNQGIFAVGVEDAIYLKRIKLIQSGIILLSDNTEYAPMELYGDELENFRVIGKVVWLCRDCR